MIPHRALAVAAVVLLSAAGLSGCKKKIEAPVNVGVCWHVATLADGSVRFNKLAGDEGRIENCVVSLEIMRLRFLGLGGSQREIVGAYQGNFLWVGPEGVAIAQEYEGHRYPAFYRSDDGRLQIPGATPATPDKPK